MTLTKELLRYKKDSLSETAKSLRQMGIAKDVIIIGTVDSGEGKTGIIMESNTWDTTELTSKKKLRAILLECVKTLNEEIDDTAVVDNLLTVH